MAALVEHNAKTTSVRGVIGPDGTVVPGTVERYRHPDPVLTVLAQRREELAHLLDGLQGERVPIHALRNVDVAAYQRAGKDRVVHGILADFTWQAVSAPLVSLREDGTYWVLDGQNRIAALRELVGPDYAMLCIVLRGLTLEQEAQGFSKINSSRHRANTSPLEEWAAALTAKEPAAVEIQAIVTSLGLRVGYRRSKSAEPTRTIGAVGALRSLHAGRFATSLRDVLQLILDAWEPEGDLPREERLLFAQAFEGNVLLGLASFLSRYRREKKFDRDELVRCLRGVTPARLGLISSDIKSRMVGRTHTTTAYARAVLELYNRGKSARRLPDWYEGSEGGAA